MAAALSLVQILFTTVLIWLYTRLQARTTVPLDLRPQAATQRRPKDLARTVDGGAERGLIFVMLVTPLLALLERSFATADGYSLTYYSELGVNRRGSVLFVPPAEAIRNSVSFALITVVLAVALGTIAARLLAGRGLQTAKTASTQRFFHQRPAARPT